MGWFICYGLIWRLNHYELIISLLILQGDCIASPQSYSSSSIHSFISTWNHSFSFKNMQNAWNTCKITVFKTKAQAQMKRKDWSIGVRHRCKMISFFGVFLRIRRWSHVQLSWFFGAVLNRNRQFTKHQDLWRNIN